MRIFLIFFMLISIGVSAQQVTEIKIDPTDCTTGNLRLNDLIETIEYIPLETTNKCLIGSIPWAHDISENHIVLYCWKTNQIYFFKRNGAFVALVGSGGSGPEEYLPWSVFFVSIDEVKKQILVGKSRPDQLSAYDFKGKFLKKYSIDSGDEAASFLRYFNNEFLVHYPNSGIASHVYEWRTSEMKTLTKAVKNIPFTIKNTFIGYPPSFEYLYEGNVYVGQPILNDTIYMITKEKAFIPTYRINLGKYEITPELRSDGDELWKRSSEFAYRFNAFELKEYLFLSSFFRDRGDEKRSCHFSYYSKSKKHLYYFDSKKGIPNDYDGGIAFWPMRQDEHIWYAFYNASDLCEETPEQKRLKPKGPEKAIQAFKQMCKKLAPDDNPVLVIIKLKK